MQGQMPYRVQFAVAATALALMASASAAAEPTTIRMATTTSTENSGLLADLLPRFRKATGIDVRVIAVGSGAALKLAEHGDVDVVLSHSPDAERVFVGKGYARERLEVMYNDFVAVGPAAEPTKLAGQTNAVACFKRIADAGVGFVSRGDDSGTHVKEKEIWKAVGLDPRGNRWYIEAGQGMEAVLVMASEKGAYTLTDRGTFIAVENEGRLSIVCEGDPRLFNPYAVMAVNPDRHPHVKYKEANQFVEWITSTAGLQTIADFRKNGRQLFFPMKQSSQVQEPAAGAKETGR